MSTISMEELRELLNKLIEVKGISSDEVIKISRDLDKLILKYYQENEKSLYRS